MIKNSIKDAPFKDYQHQVNNTADFLYSIEVIEKEAISENGFLFLILQDFPKTYIFHTNQRRSGLTAILKDKNQLSNHFIGDFTKRQIDAGNYQLGIGVQQGTTLKKYYLNDSLLIK